MTGAGADLGAFVTGEACPRCESRGTLGVPEEGWTRCLRCLTLWGPDRVVLLWTPQFREGAKAHVAEYLHVKPKPVRELFDQPGVLT